MKLESATLRQLKIATQEFNAALSQAIADGYQPSVLSYADQIDVSVTVDDVQYGVLDYGSEWP